MMYDTLTHHMIDDDVAPQDEAMDSFRSAFRLVANEVAADGKTMQYWFRNESMANRWQTDAERIINSLNLPLVTELTGSGIAGGLFNSCLNIIYKPF